MPVRVTVGLYRDNGTLLRTAAYDAPEDIAVGDAGLAEFGSEYPRTYAARVLSLGSAYTGPARMFRRLARAASGLAAGSTMKEEA